MKFETTNVPEPWSKNDHRASQLRYSQSPLGSTTRRDYLRANAKDIRAQKKIARGEEWLNRSFIALDGEGTDSDTEPGRQNYSLLAASTGETIVAENGLSHVQILDYLFGIKRSNPDGILVVYGASYDWNMWLRHLDREDVERLYRSSEYEYINGVGYKLRMRKSLDIKRGKESVRIYDVIPFFQCKFTAACDSYLKDDPLWLEHRERIVEGKSGRGAFKFSELESITEYNDAELQLLVRLMETLRDSLDQVGIRPKRWDGPGAIASALMTEKRIPHALSRANRISTPRGVQDATERAFTAGRFESIRSGVHHHTAYQYDINSAYPNALRHVPCLAHGTWRHMDGDAGRKEFALYRVGFRHRDAGRVLQRSGRRGTQSHPSKWEVPVWPLFCRTRNGNVWYPPRIDDGWYWSPEVDVLREYADSHGMSWTDYSREFTPSHGVNVSETWWFEHNDVEHLADPNATESVKPFKFVEGMYDDRLEYKRTGNGAEKGLKLGLNSLYGKLCQQVGWQPAGPGDKASANHRTRSGKGVRIPPFHQLEWAGYTTSHCRALIMRAVMSEPDSVIAIETDAVFTLVPLELDCGKALGQWERTEYAKLAYVKSGIAFLTKLDGTTVCKFRGVESGILTIGDYMNALITNGTMDTTVTRFIGMGSALSQDFSKWCYWVEIPRRETPYPTGKRQMIEGVGHVGDMWGCLMPTQPSMVFTALGEFTSHAHRIEWEDRERASDLRSQENQNDDFETDGEY